MSARVIDENGFILIKNNPISKAGVFPYLGSSIGGDAEPDKVYNVYRPEEELMDPECLDSFKLIPLINDHEMLGKGFTPAEKYGIEGTTGSNIHFKDGELLGDLKVFSESLADRVERGKKDLSLGYRCIYIKSSGSYKGIPYDYIQTKLRGNHIALVDEARCDVAVLDGITFDHLDIISRKENEMSATKKVKKKAVAKDNAELTLEGLAARFEELFKIVQALSPEKQEEVVEEVEEAVAEVEETEEEEVIVDEEETEETSEDEEESDDDTEGGNNDRKESLGKALDGRRKKVVALDHNAIAKKIMGEINARNELANELSTHVGAFDHADKTYNEVVKYGMKKLGLDSAKGQEAATLSGYLAAAKKFNKPMNVRAMDSSKAQGSSLVDKHFN